MLKHLLCLSLMSLLTVLCLTQCSSGKYFSDQKTFKKEVDTLTIFRPVVFVNALKDDKVTRDYKRSGELQSSLYSKISSILGAKYVLSNASDTIRDVTESQLNEFFEMLEKPNTVLSNIKIPEYFKTSLTHSKTRYSLITFYSGIYDSAYDAAFRERQLLLNNMMYFNLHISKSHLRIIVFDKTEHRIIHYDKKVLKNADPRVPVQIEKMTSSILKPIYYR